MSLDPAAVASQNGAQSLFKNGPRYWTLDQLTQPGTKQIGTFNNIEAKWWGATTISGTGGASAGTPYTETRWTGRVQNGSTSPAPSYTS